MKRIKNYIPVILMILAMVITSCDDELEKLPPLNLSNEYTLSTYDGLVQATNATYSQFYSANWYGRDYPVILDLKGGDGKSSPLNSGRFQLEYNWGNNASNTSGVYDNVYTMISRANNVINAIPDIDEPGVTEEQLNQLEGECLFLRAYAHWDGIRMFAQPYTYEGGNTPGVPIIRETKIASPARNTVKEVYEDLIVPDLLAAEGLIGDDSREGLDSKAFADKQAVQALLAKVYLYMGQWQNAADYATAVIESGEFTMYTEENFLDVWGINASSEVIFEVYGNSTESSWPGFDEIGYIYYPDGYGDVCASNQLLDLYTDTDVRADLFMTWEGYESFMWPTKYPGKEGVVRVNNVPLLRLSEMYLIRAEAILNGASVAGTTALDDYNMIRTNRGLAAEIEVTLQDIYDERRRELCFEGNAMADLKRTGRGLDRDEAETLVTGDVDIPFPDYRWAMPIPQFEIDANPNMVQNEGY